jgi:hypothetical protein
MLEHSTYTLRLKKTAVNRNSVPALYLLLKFGKDCKSFCCILRGPGGERIVETDLELQLRRGVEQAAHTRNNPHVKCTGVY